jgi:SAM-dependent methyltransferase
MWTPLFACPECRVELQSDRCAPCGRAYRHVDGIWRFLTPERRAALEPFVEQYRLVRSQDGHRQTSADYYRALPSVTDGDPRASEWHIRRETYGNLLRHVFAAAPQSIRVLDVGAGSGWLSHRLAELGHRPVAVDAVDDEADGLGAAKHFTTAFEAVQADFTALPFVAGQFDLVVFNAALHYVGDPAVALAHARTMLAAGGALVVMDSPMFQADHDGRAMTARAADQMRVACGLTAVVQPGAGYLTFAALDRVAAALRLEPRFIASRGSFGWRARRQLARIRLGRAPAAFGLWVAR